ncbi:hypothetical protein [Micromonospora sp. NBC_01796]|uniref:hypothetical protein n=1 Tax=Micromonospora sp. NBC_01796 TaxID=2975987 RepID=UPI002DD7C48A|nr:hypothetical protein [Micromonospora sp. NBC_01796]WSA88154.1 hypothetical protein OIE47_11360 [Micromonospora sp. NBC_01796]
MNEPELLDLVENLFRAAEHPEITEVGPIPGSDHAPAGVKVMFESGAKGMLLVFPRGGWPKQSSQGGGR